LAGYH